MERPTTPSTEDAQLVLRLYDLRREEVMRASRSTMLRWMPASAEDCIAITRFDHPDNAAFRQVSSYFEMAYGFARHGAVHAELLAEVYLELLGGRQTRLSLAQSDAGAAAAAAERPYREPRPHAPTAAEAAAHATFLAAELKDPIWLRT